MKFEKEHFNYHGGYLTYEGDCGKFNAYFEEPCHPSRLGMRKDAFVARFKYSGYARFRDFLIKNFDVEEYFQLTDRNGENLAPLTALETKGFVSDNALKALKARNKAGANYPLTLEGFNQMIQDDVEKHYAA